MKKLKIAINILGHKHRDFDSSALLKWSSALWEVHDNKIDTIALSGNCDLIEDWAYSDRLLCSRTTTTEGADISIFILNAPLQDRYYSRRIATNVVCISFHEVSEPLKSHNIPMENFVLRMIYNCVLLYARKKKVPSIIELASISHHETKGCIFDMTGIQAQVVFSCDRPILCESCIAESKEDKVSQEFLSDFTKEIKRIKKRRYYQIADWIKRAPLLALFLSSFLALIIGILGSLTASYIYEKINNSSNEVPVVTIPTSPSPEPKL